MSAAKAVGIIGGGIGGLTAANALKQKGFSVRVFEQASHFLPTAGAGFGFSPNGQICLASLGMQTRHLVHPFERLVRLNAQGDVSIESHVFGKIKDKLGFSIGGTLRADLVDHLKAPLGDSLLYSHRLQGLSQTDDAVELSFDNGHKESFDLVLGCDGIHSSVAQMIGLESTPPTFCSANIFYGVIPDPDAIEWRHPALQTECAERGVIQGPGTGEFISFRVGPEDRKLHVWATTYSSATSPVSHEGSGSGDVSEWAHFRGNKELQDVLAQYPAGHPLHELVSRTSPDRLLHFGLFNREHKSVWSAGRVCLLGDAVHATLPYVGQGANQAIEDAVVLATCLETHREDHASAFAAYTAQRVPRTKRVVTMANVMNTLYHTKNPVLRWLTDKLLDAVANGGLVYKNIEDELINNCPIKNWEEYRRS
jgi:salicylate hydroxylase